MASTSVHFPSDLLRRLDRAARRRRVSRNRLIVEACEQAVDYQREWPTELISNERLSAEDLAELRRSWREWQRAISAGRRSRRKPPF